MNIVENRRGTLFTPRLRRRFFSVLVAVVVTIAGMGLGGEIVARLLGLGDPPLVVRHPTIDYLFAPSRCYKRFGNDICYNKWSMRSIPADRFPLLMLGDSVLNGGSLTDQSELASELIRSKRGITVGNVSAGSWGPSNLLAYTNEFGWFGARLIIMWSAFTRSRM